MARGDACVTSKVDWCLGARSPPSRPELLLAESTRNRLRDARCLSIYALLCPYLPSWLGGLCWAAVIELIFFGVDEIKVSTTVWRLSASIAFLLL